MNAHELQYFRFLLQCLKDAYIENAAMSTVLDNVKYRPRNAPDWRTVVEDMTKDEVFRSSVEANRAPYWERVRLALSDAKILADLKASDQ